VNATPLYPLRFEPIYQYRLWGGRRLAHLLSAPLPADDPIGEAWVLSDRDDHASVVADGPLKGKTIAEILAQSREPLLGELAGRFKRFPLLLKFLDVRTQLSVQVHPSGEAGKTEAWIVLENGPKACILAGFKTAISAQDLRHAIANATLAEHLARFPPKIGDTVLIPAGTVHSLSDVVVFEVQQNCDVTFRLYDWDHLDPRTGRPRPLQVEQALDSIDFEQGAIGPVAPQVESLQPVRREKLIQSERFGVTRIGTDLSFLVGVAGLPRVLVCLTGNGHIEHAATRYGFGQGDVVLLPAVLGPCLCRPEGRVSVLEISMPETPSELAKPQTALN
jgi:mannose-6-phosphate isomerase